MEDVGRGTVGGWGIYVDNGIFVRTTGDIDVKWEARYVSIRKLGFGRL